MFDKLNAVEARYDELMALVSDAAVQADQNEYRKHTKALSEIQGLVETFREYKAVVEEAAQAQELAEGTGEDPELRELARLELKARSSPVSASSVETRSSPRSRSSFSRKIKTTNAMSSWRSGPERAVTKPGCLPPTCFECTRGLRKPTAGGSRCCRRTRQVSVRSRRSWR